jgi:hypothetical protein
MEQFFGRGVRQGHATSRPKEQQQGANAMPRPTDRTPLTAVIALALLAVPAAVPVLAEEAEEAEKSPLMIWEGDDDSHFKATFKAAAAYFMQNNSWFGQSDFPGKRTGSWWETYLHPGFEGSYALENSSKIYGRVSGVVGTTNGVDAAGSNIPYGDVTGGRMEDVYVGWRSGGLFGDLGDDFLDISVGRQQYVVGNGFLFYNQSSNGQNRGAFWMGERQAAKFSGIVRMKTGNWKADLVYFEADDNPKTDTELGGLTLDYTFSEDIGGIGGGIYTLRSDLENRDSMNVYDIRFSLFPFEAFDAPDVLKPVKLEGEYVYEENGDLVDDSGWYLSAGYQWKDLAWTPSLTYRYSSFSENYDPLFYGFNDWGYWYQGEVLGEYALVNSNLEAHMLKLNVKPIESVSVNLFYYNFNLKDAAAFGVQSADFADEWDLTVDWTATDNLTISAVAGYVSADDGAKEWIGGDEGWAYGMIYAAINF